MSAHGITCGTPPCPYYHGDADGLGQCRHRSPRAHRLRWDANEYCSIWPPVHGGHDWCGYHPSLIALVRRSGELLDNDQ